MLFKRKKIFLSLFATLFLIAPQLVGATIYNGEGYKGPGGTGGNCPTGDFSKNKFCPYNNSNHQTVKVSLYYFYDNQTRVQLGNSIYITNNSYASTSVLGITVNNMYVVDGFTWNNAESHFMSDDYFKNYIAAMGVDYDSLTADRVEACTLNGAEYGYRVIIEPVLSVYRHADGNYFLKTIKEIAAQGNLTNSSRWDGSNGASDKFSVAMYTNCNDVGISMVAAAGTADSNLPATKDTSIISSAFTGYGYNIIDPGDKIPPPQSCYQTVIDGDPAVCINDGSVNVGTFTETVEEVACTDSVDESIQEYGRLELETDTYQVYCTEKAQQFFPGNYKGNVQIGTHLVWPTNENSNKNDYFMKIRGRKVCTIVGTVDDATRTSIKNSISSIYRNEFKHDVSVSWDDGTYTKQSVDPYGSVSVRSTASDDRVTVTIDVDYSLPENFNRFVDKETGKAMSTRPSHSNYVDIGYGNLYVSSKASEYGIYELSIDNNSLGSDNLFGEILNYQDYTCYYEVTDVSCVCPIGTAAEGKDLISYIKEHGGTCADAQRTQCCECPRGTLLAGRDLTYEMNVYGLSCSQAQNNFCDIQSINCECPIWTPGYPNDLTDEMNRFGYTCSQAQDRFCYSSDPNPEVCVTCPLGTPQSGKSVYCPDGDCERARHTTCMRYTLPESEYCESGDTEDCKICDAGTINAGINIKCNGDCNLACSKVTLNENDFCDSEPSDEYCPEPYDDINITACLVNGGSYEQCTAACGPISELKCPDDPNGTDPMSSVYRECVYEKIGLGFNIDTARNLCYEKCDGNPNGIDIIYRTISLTNPFPSYNSDKTVTQPGLSVGMFNDTIKGRYPGANWNSEELVKEKILNNRNVDGDEVYSLQPLYTFVLDTETIKEIRRYNRNQTDGYADFNLNCLINNSTACKSSFVHNPRYGLTGGTCGITMTASNFYTCDN